MIKRISALLLLLGFQNYAFSQRLDFIKGVASSYLMGINWSSWTDYPQNIKVNSFSNRGFEYLQINKYNKDKVIRLYLGLGISSNNFHTDVAIWGFDSTGTLKTGGIITDYISNKLNVVHANGWAELNYHAKTDKDKEGFRIGAGFKVGYRIDQHTKWHTSLQTVKYKKVDALNNYSYGPTLRIGFKGYSLFGQYGMVSLFSKADKTLYKPVLIGLLIGQL